MTGLKKAVNAVIGVLAALVLLNYTVYLIHLLAFPEQPLAFIITFCVIGAVLLPVIFRKKLRKLLGKAYPILKGIWALCLLFYVVSFAVMTVGIISSKETAPSANLQSARHAPLQPTAISRPSPSGKSRPIHGIHCAEDLPSVATSE